MVNTNKLRGRIVEKGMNIGILADMMGLSASTLGRKLRNTTDIALSEVVCLMDILQIPKKDFFDYFICE